MDKFRKNIFCQYIEREGFEYVKYERWSINLSEFVIYKKDGWYLGIHVDSLFVKIGRDNFTEMCSFGGYIHSNRDIKNIFRMLKVK